MSITYKQDATIVVALPKCPKDKEIDFGADNETLEDNKTNLFDVIEGTLEEEVDTLNTHKGKTVEHMPPRSGSSTPTLVADKKKGKPIPRARTVEYGGEVYPSLTKCLKALNLCRDRFKYVKKSRPELKTDNAIIGLLIHERRKEAQQASSYVVAIKGEVTFHDYLTGACTVVNRTLELAPKKAMTQGMVSKYRYEHNKRAKNKDRPITLQEAFTSCLTRVLMREQMLTTADEQIFKARMAMVANDVNDVPDLFDVVGEDSGHIAALKDLTEQYHGL